jgi:hypothetical protein
MDGANNNDVGSNRSILSYPSIEAISEFKMLRNSYGAEYRQASGAVINIVTRSGSNQCHGDVLYFGRNTHLTLMSISPPARNSWPRPREQFFPTTAKTFCAAMISAIRSAVR